MKALFGGLAAAALAAQPVAAAADFRAAPAIAGESEMGGDSGLLLGLGIFIAVIAIFYVAAESDDPASP